MIEILKIIQIVIAFMLMIGILLQQRGSGLGAAFGGENTAYLTKRGAEKVIFVLTIILAILLFALGIVRLIISS